jgi:hypothetical protein
MPQPPDAIDEKTNQLKNTSLVKKLLLFLQYTELPLLSVQAQKYGG